MLGVSVVSRASLAKPRLKETTAKVQQNPKPWAASKEGEEKNEKVI